MKLYPLLLLALGLLCSISSPLLADDFYVSPAGTDNGICSVAQPCREIRQALSLVSAGDAILVEDGQYLGFTMSSQSGAPGSPITIQALGNNAEILPTSDRSDNRDNILISNSDYVVIDGLNTFNAPRAGIRVDQSHNVALQNNTLGNNTTWGIFTNHSNDLLIAGNEAFGSQTQHGIYVSNSGDRPIIRDNIVYDNDDAGIQINADLSAGGGRDVVGDGITTGAVIERNTIFNNGQGGAAGINLDGVQDSIVRNNLLYDNHASGIAMFQIDGGAGPADIDVYNNTIDMAPDGRWAIRITQSEGEIESINNILINRNTNRGGISLAFEDSGLQNSDLANLVSDYNIFDDESFAATPNDDTNRYFLNSWQAFFNQDLNSFTADPDLLFVDLANRDYRLTFGSPAIDAGLFLAAVPDDIRGFPRPFGAAYDIGAYEFIGDVTPPPPSPIPEPATMFLFGMGAMGTLLKRRA